MRRLFSAVVLILCAAVCIAAPPRAGVLAEASTTLGPYKYDGSGNIGSIGSNEQFVYDLSSRLVSATVLAGTQTYTYDASGNRTSASTTGNVTHCNGGTDCHLNQGIDPDSNRFRDSANPQLVQYDDAGNLRLLDGRAYSWTADGVMASQQYQQKDVQYIYTADDERIAVYNGSWEWSLRDEKHRLVRQFTSVSASASPAWVSDNVFGGDRVLASERPNAVRRHFHVDHLGTPRLITDDSGRKVGEYEYYPFGTQPDTGARENPAEELKFTGHQRDLADGDAHVLDYMHARYYDGAEGRFLSVDPVLDLKNAVRVPQMWNRYSYVMNNSMRFRDPTGKYLCSGTKAECTNFEEALKIVRTAAAEAEKKHTEGAARLGLIVKMYGAAGKDTGVNVNFGSSWGRMDTIVKGAGQVTITVNRDEFNADVQGNRLLHIAGSIAHEGDHGLFGRANPIVRLTRSYDMIYQEELSGYRSSGYMYQALGVNDTIHSIWQVGTGWTPMLEHFAKQSAQQDCDIRGGCH